MDFLNPCASLERLVRQISTFVHAKPEARPEARTELERAINYSEIALSNLVHRMGDDFDQRQLYKQLLVQVEIAKGTLHQASARR